MMRLIKKTRLIRLICICILLVCGEIVVGNVYAEEIRNREENTNIPNKIVITGSKYVAKGKKITLRAELKSSEADQSIAWKSGDEKIATVNKNGVVKGISAGTVKIFAISKADKKIRKSVKITVTSKPVEKIVITKKITLDLNGNKTRRITPDVKPENSAKSFLFKSNNCSVATVTKNGKIKAISKGNAVITITSTDGSKKKAKVKVKVIDSTPTSTPTIEPTSTPTPVPTPTSIPWYDLGGLSFFAERNRLLLGSQDIAIYNDVLIGFGAGSMYMDGKRYSITNGHGNNCMFGKTLHGEYPYLYCGSWNKDSCKVYVNQISKEGATLISTISYPDLSGYLNCCIDELNQRIYILLCTSERTNEGVVDFIVSDFSGNLLSRKNIDKIPTIQGMTFHNGHIYVLSGSGSSWNPNTISVLNTKGDLISKNNNTGITDEFEGIEFSGNSLYIATMNGIYKK